MLADWISGSQISQNWQISELCYQTGLLFMENEP